MNEYGVSTLMEGAKKVSLLTKEQECDLAARMRSNDPKVALAARNHLISANIRFVTHLAHGYVKSSETDLEDFVSAGLEAMVKNAEKFDPSKANFCTFIKPWIKKAFQELRYSDTTVTVPRHRHISINKVHRASERLVAEHGPFADITSAMIAEATGMSVEDVDDCFALHSEFLGHSPSLDAPVGDDDGATLMETIADKYADDDYEEFSAPMADALSSLTGEETQVLMMVAGLDGDTGMSEPAIAKALNIKVGVVRSLLASARVKMSDSMAASL